MKDVVVLNHREGNEMGLKARNLGELSRRGLPVPNGLVFSITDPANLSEIFSFIATELTTPLIIRSSANVEDGKQASFAGIFESQKNIKTLEQFVSAVNVLSESLKHPRLVVYARKQGIDLSQIKLNYIVQEYKKSTVSGVLFTESPENPAQLLIEYSSVAEGLTSGSSEVSRIIIEKDTGNFEYVEQSLKKKDIEKLITYAREIEAIYGAPQDIEWVISRGKIWIVQTRPITKTNSTEGIEREIQRLVQLLGARPPILVRKAFAEEFEYSDATLIASMQRLYSQDGAYGRALRKLGIFLAPFDPKQYIVEVFGRPYVNESLEKEFLPFVPEDTATRLLVFACRQLVQNPKQALRAWKNFGMFIFSHTILRIRMYWEYSRLEKKDILSDSKNFDVLVEKSFYYGVFQEFLYSFLKEKLNSHISREEWTLFIQTKSATRENIIARFADAWSQQIVSLSADMFDRFTSVRETLHTALMKHVAPIERNSIYAAVSLPARIEIASWADLLKQELAREGSLSGVALSHGFSEGILGTVDMLNRGEKVDILVTSTIDPSLVEYFGKIKGVVTRAGGELSHAAILAREYGIPMVKIDKDLSADCGKKASISGDLLHFS